VGFTSVAWVFLGSASSYIGSRDNGVLVQSGSFFHIQQPDPIDTQTVQTIDMSQPPALTPLSLSHLCARYLRLQFENKLNASSPGAGVTPIGLPLMLPIALASELDLISSTLVDAFRNPS